MRIRYEVSFFCLLASLLVKGHLSQAQNSPTFTIAIRVKPQPTPIACTMEAKLCPDGSSVSRTGPNCEFAPCPDAGGSTGSGNPIWVQPPPTGGLAKPGPEGQTSPGQTPDSDGNDANDADGADGMAPDSVTSTQNGVVSVGSGSAIAGVAVAGPARVINMRDVGLSKYPDEPFDYIPSEPQTVKFVVEHRTMLNEKHITIHGTIVSTLLGEQACPTRKTSPMMGRPCAQPRIVLADTYSPDRDTNYDVTVLLQPDDKTSYTTEQSAEFSATVSGNSSNVTLRKD